MSCGSLRQVFRIHICATFPFGSPLMRTASIMLLQALMRRTISQVIFDRDCLTSAIFALQASPPGRLPAAMAWFCVTDLVTIATWAGLQQPRVPQVLDATMCAGGSLSFSSFQISLRK